MQAFAVHDEEEGAVNEGGTGVVLQDNQACRNEEQQADQAKAAQAHHLETVAAYDVGNGKTGGKFPEFGGLDADAADVKPGARPLGLDAENEHRHEGKHDEHVDGDGKRREKFTVYQHDEGCQDEGCPNPHQLLAVALGDVEDAAVVFIVNGGVDVQPADENQCQVNQDGHPIDVL